ncbi:MAG: membrane protein [Lysobacteraceae bacterium]|nr:MAG: membrane protein [Xanthomonadaceae bacterium]
MSTLMTIAIFAAIVGSAMISGIFFAFSNFIMKALQRVPSTEGLLAMQTINVTVLNPGFLGLFMGTALICLILAVTSIAEWEVARSPYLLGGAALYIGGTWLVTALGNVPLNNKLAGMGRETPESLAVWAHYLDHWTKLNSLRAGAAMGASALFLIGLTNSA